MLKTLFISFVIFTNLLSNEFYINPYFEDKLEKNSKSYNIIKDYERFMNSLKTLSKIQKIQKVNRYINAIIPSYDVYNYNSEEHWATIFEFFSRGSGDCEDYVIAKRYSLKLLGIPTSSMYFSAVKEKYIGGNHMVLALIDDKEKEPLILDNLSTKVLSIDKRVDLETMFMFNETGFYKLEKFKYLVKMKNKYLLAYEDMKAKEKFNLLLKR